MNAKKKANEIGNLFYEGTIFEKNKREHLNELVRAKKRAKLCVNELIKVVGSKYWYDVLNEIDSL